MVTVRLIKAITEMPAKNSVKNYMSYEIPDENWLSKETPKEVSNLRPLTLPFAFFAA
jgi:hypothetical protein